MSNQAAATYLKTAPLLVSLLGAILSTNFTRGLSTRGISFSRSFDLATHFPSSACNSTMVAVRMLTARLVMLQERSHDFHEAQAVWHKVLGYSAHLQQHQQLLYCGFSCFVLHTTQRNALVYRQSHNDKPSASLMSGSYFHSCSMVASAYARLQRLCHQL